MINPLVFSVSILALAGCSDDKNAKLIYGETELPKNCRAIIATNVSGWRSGQYKPAEALESIDRNCGANGYSWKE